MTAPRVSRQQKTRMTVVAGLMTGIIILGTWVGAAYRETSDIQKERKKLRQASIPEQIAILERQRDHLEHSKALLDAKILNNRERTAARLRKLDEDGQRRVDEARWRDEERRLDRQREEMLTRRRADVFQRQREAEKGK